MAKKEKPKKKKGHVVLSSTSDGNTKARKTIVHGKVTRDDKGKS